MRCVLDGVGHLQIDATRALNLLHEAVTIREEAVSGCSVIQANFYLVCTEGYLKIAFQSCALREFAHQAEQCAEQCAV